MLLKFTKMHGLGNDFMVVDCVRQKAYFSTELIRRLADRHFGVGFDQLLLIEPPYSPELDFHYRIFNADGSEVQMCGNGARCFARFVLDHKLTSKKEIRVSTISGELTLKVHPDETVTVNMGRPDFNPAALPFTASGGEAAEYELEPDGWGTVKCGAVSMGNPHITLYLPQVDDETVAKLGAVLERHPAFPERVNVGFAVRLNEHEINLRVFERGCGETMACGTGACAAAAIGIRQGRLKSPVTVHLPGGTLSISIEGPDSPVLMTGPAVRVFEGTIAI